MKRIALILSLLIGLLIFALTIMQAGVGNVLKIISFFPLSALVAIFFVDFVAVCLVGSLRWKIIIESQNSHKVSFIKVLRAKLAGFAISYITPSILIGGEPVRAYMIKEETEYNWEKSFASVIIDQAIYFFVLFLFMIIGFLFLADHFSLPISIFYGFGIIFFTIFLILYLFYSRLINKNSDGHGFFMFIFKTTKLDKIKFIRKREKNIQKTEEVIANFFKKERKVFLKAFLLAIVEVVFYLIIIWMITLYLGRAIDFARSASIFFILTFANFVPIPGSLGSFEASLTFIFDLLNLGKSNGFSFSLIFRLINIVLVLVGFFALVHFELKTISYNFGKNAPEMILKIHRFLTKIVHRK